MKTFIVGILALVFALGFDASSFARNGGGGPSSGAGGQERSMDRPRADRDKDKDRDDIKKDNQHSNKGGQLRGLDRADEVAGEHGAKGRENARKKQDQDK